MMPRDASSTYLTSIPTFIVRCLFLGPCRSSFRCNSTARLPHYLKHLFLARDIHYIVTELLLLNPNPMLRSPIPIPDLVFPRTYSLVCGSQVTSINAVMFPFARNILQLRERKGQIPQQQSNRYRCCRGETGGQEKAIQSSVAEPLSSPGVDYLSLFESVATNLAGLWEAERDLSGAGQSLRRCSSCGR